MTQPTARDDSRGDSTAPGANVPSPAEQLRQRAERPAPGLLAELVDFLLHNKKWWLTPIIVVLLLVGLLLVLGSSSIAPLIYPLF